MQIVGLATNDWHSQWVNRQHLLSRLGEKHEVLYSNGAWSVWDRNSPEWKKAGFFGGIRGSDNVVVEAAPKFLLRWPKWPSFDELVVRAHAHRLKRHLQHGRSTNRLVLAFYPSFFPYLRYMNADLVVYHAFDLFEATPGWNPQHEALEIAFLKKADLVTASSKTIAQRLEEKSSREVRVLPNGVDLAAFHFEDETAKSIPADLARIPKPRLGYIGSLHPQVDYGLVARLAQSRPAWNFVFIGASSKARDAQSDNERDACTRCANVHFLGEKDRSEIPDYLLNMDVNLMVYRVSNETWIRAGYPLKLHEYLAAGKPIVSADLPTIRDFADVVQISSDTADWLRAIEYALDHGGSGTVSSRRDVAAKNTWDSRVATLDAWITSLAEKRW